MTTSLTSTDYDSRLPFKAANDRSLVTAALSFPWTARTSHLSFIIRYQKFKKKSRSSVKLYYRTSVTIKPCLLRLNRQRRRITFFRDAAALFNTAAASGRKLCGGTLGSASDPVPPHQLVQADHEEVGQLDKLSNGRFTSAAFVILISSKVNAQIFRNFSLLFARFFSD